MELLKRKRNEDEIGKDLKSLNLKGKRVAEIPRCLAEQLSRVRKVDICGSRLFELPDSMTSLEVVKGFKLQSTTLNPLHPDANFKQMDARDYDPASFEILQEINVIVDSSNESSSSDSGNDGDDSS